MVLPKNKSRRSKVEVRFWSTGSRKIKNSEDNSSESEPCSDVSFGWVKVKSRPADTEDKTVTENMASESDSDSSDNSTSSNEPSEHNAEDGGNNEIVIKEENKSGSEASDVDNTSSEEETHKLDYKRTDAKINNTEVPEDASSDSDGPESNKEQQELLKVPGNYVPLPVRSGGLLLEHLTEDDEVWMMQCPVFVNPQDLKGKKIMFGETSEFAIKTKDGKEQLYETSSYTDINKSLSCLLPTGKSGQLVAKVVEPVGLIVIKQKICVVDLEDDDDNDDDDPVPTKRNFNNIPTDLKIRHPLFGSGFQEELDARSIIIEDNVKKKKKKHKSKDKSDTNHKRKRKMINDEVASSSANKRHKIEEEEELAAEEEYKAHEDCDVDNSIKHKKKKKKKSKNRDSENEEEIISKKKKKKKSKNKDIENLNIEDVIVKEEYDQEEDESQEILPKKKKKHKKKSKASE